MNFKHFEIIFFSAAVVAFVVFRYAWVNSIWPFQSKLMVACEERLIGRLISPSSYKRISVDETSTSIGAVEYQKIENDEIAKLKPGVVKDARRLDLERDIEDIKAGIKKVYQKKTTINFDASNNFGVAIRGAARCGYIKDGEYSSPGPYSIDFDLDL